jgi:RNA polymerase sigma-70 factor (ECF subfamily)
MSADTTLLHAESAPSSRFDGDRDRIAPLGHSRNATVTMHMAMSAVQVPRREQTLGRVSRLERIFNDNYRLVWRIVRRLGLPVDAADDAAQQVFLIAAERLDDILGGSERSFVYGTALRLASRYRRKMARELPSEEADQAPSPLPRPDELADQKRARQLLDAVLDRLPAELRTVFVLFEFEGMTTPEIAELVRIPVGTAASRLRRARESFREHVANLGSSEVTKRGTP